MGDHSSGTFKRLNTFKDEDIKLSVLYYTLNKLKTSTSNLILKVCLVFFVSFTQLQSLKIVCLVNFLDEAESKYCPIPADNMREPKNHQSKEQG